jgi:hypothetical protein
MQKTVRKVFSNCRELPDIEKYQVWCCAMGCGNCEPIPLTRDDTSVIFASSCCGDGLMLWDEMHQAFVPATTGDGDRV